MNGKKGVFPDNFVEEIVGDASGGDAGGGDADAIKPHKPEKMGFGNAIFAGGMPTLKKTGTFSGSNSGVIKPSKKSSPKTAPKVPQSANRAAPPAAAAVDISAMDIVKVEFDYKPENTDEIGLTKDSFVNVTKRDDGGWWEGEVVGDPGKKGCVLVHVCVRACGYIHVCSCLCGCG